MHLWDTIKDGGALVVCVIVIAMLHKGFFITKHHHDEVLKAKDAEIALLKQAIERLKGTDDA